MVWPDLYVLTYQMSLAVDSSILKTRNISSSALCMWPRVCRTDTAVGLIQNPFFPSQNLKQNLIMSVSGKIKIREPAAGSWS